MKLIPLAEKKTRTLYIILSTFERFSGRDQIRSHGDILHVNKEYMYYISIFLIRKTVDSYTIDLSIRKIFNIMFAYIKHIDYIITSIL